MHNCRFWLPLDQCRQDNSSKFKKKYDSHHNCVVQTILIYFCIEETNNNPGMSLLKRNSFLLFD